MHVAGTPTLRWPDCLLSIVCRVSWDDWEDRQSGVAGYAYQIVGVSDLSGRGKATVFTNASAMVRMIRRFEQSTGSARHVAGCLSEVVMFSVTAAHQWEALAQLS